MGIWQTILIGAAVSVIVIVFITAKDDEGDDRDDLQRYESNYQECGT